MRQDEMIQDTEYKHLAVMHQMREELSHKQHQTELANQREYTMRAEREMKQKHNTETKQMPKHLKVFNFTSWEIYKKKWHTVIYSFIWTPWYLCLDVIKGI